MKHNPEYRWQNKTFRPAAKGDECDADFLDLQNAFYDAFFRPRVGVEQIYRR